MDELKIHYLLASTKNISHYMHLLLAGWCKAEVKVYNNDEHFLAQYTMLLKAGYCS